MFAENIRVSVDKCVKRTNATNSMRGSTKLCQGRGGGSNTGSVFLVAGMERGSKLPLKVGHHLAFRWRADIGPPLNSGLVAL